MREVDVTSLLGITQSRKAVTKCLPFPEAYTASCKLPPAHSGHLAPEATSKPVSGRSSHSYAQYRAWGVTKAVRPVYSGQPRVAFKSTDQKIEGGSWAHCRPLREQGVCPCAGGTGPESHAPVGPSLCQVPRLATRARSRGRQLQKLCMDPEWHSVQAISLHFGL
jgi:hypothetical protein